LPPLGQTRRVRNSLPGATNTRFVLLAKYGYSQKRNSKVNGKFVICFTNFIGDPSVAFSLASAGLKFIVDNGLANK
jgi:hypothetical protein